MFSINCGPMRILSIHLTDLCNSNCRFCVVGVPGRIGNSFLEKQARRLLIEKACEGFDLVNLHGGEPTLSSDFIGTLQLIKELGYPGVYLQTNGCRLSDPYFARDVVDLNVKTVIVSLHGSRAKIHDWATRSHGSFKVACKAIKNVKKAGGTIRTNTVIFRQNLSELPDIVDLALDIGADSINISNLHPAMTAYEHFEIIAPFVEETACWLERAICQAKDRNAEITLEGFPYCVIPGYDELHLNRENVRIEMEIRGNWIPDYMKFMKQKCRTKGSICGLCLYKERCGGVYREYIEKRGWQEFRPIEILHSQNLPKC